MSKTYKNITLIGLVLSVLGVILSLILTIEFYSLGSENIANSLCSATGGGNSCETVAQSKFSAIRSVPFLGDLPVALFGAGFYGALFFMYGAALRAKEDQDFKQIYQVITILSLLAVIIDVILLLISVGFIGTICTLCFITYFISIGSLSVGFMVIKDWIKNNQPWMDSVKNQFSTLAITFLLSFSLVQFAAKLYSKDSAGSLANSGNMESGAFKEQMQRYKESPGLAIKTSGTSILGKKDAPITIVKYADFNCGHCMHASEVLHTVLSEYDGMVKVVYQNFPLDGSCNRFVEKPRPEASSCVAATASICASRQGKFEPMYRGLYDNQAKGVYHTTSTVLNLANNLGLDASKFKACLGSQDASKQLMAEIEEAGRLNILATPSLFINDRAIKSGTPDPKFLKVLLDDLIKKL